MSVTQATARDIPRVRRRAGLDVVFRLAAGSAALLVPAVLAATAASMFVGGLPASV